MSWEEKAKELASKASSGPRYAVKGTTWETDMWQTGGGWTVSPEAARGGWCTDGGRSEYGIPKRDAEFIAYNDSTTIALVADVVRAARNASFEYPGGMDYMRLVNILRDRLSALDAHTKETP